MGEVTMKTSSPMTVKDIQDNSVLFRNPLLGDSWDDEVRKMPEAGFFHSKAWAAVLAETYGYNPLYMCSFEKDRMTGLMPLMQVKPLPSLQRGVSLPFTDYCDPLCGRHDFDNFFNAACITGAKKNWRYLEIRTAKQLLDNEPSYASFFGHTLDLSEGTKSIYNRLHSSCKRNIKKAEREGVKMKIGNSWEDMQAYYRLHCMTRQRQGVPPQPIKFFKSIHDHVISKGHGIILSAEYRGKRIAGNVCFHFDDKAVYKYGASDRNCQDVRANNLVMWEAIQYCLNNDFGSFCFGRTDIEDAGLRRFKLAWGATETIIRYYRYAISEKAFIAGRQPCAHYLQYAFKRVPIPILRCIGTAAYGYMG